MLEELKALSRRVVGEIYNAGDLDVVEELFHPQYVQKPIGYKGQAGARRFVEELHAAFSNLSFDLVGQIAEDDSVVNLLIMSGEHTGALLDRIPPGGANVVVIYAIIHRYVDGRIVEGVIVSDQLSLMQQIGVVPTPVWANTTPG